MAERYDEFGDVLAARDFNNDGYADLVVGASEEDEEAEQVGDAPITDAGSVTGLYGSPRAKEPKIGTAAIFQQE